MISRHVIISVVITFVSAQDPIVEVSQGLIRGIRALSIRDRDFYAFLGVPYAKPPVGELRFKAPQPPEPWSGVYDATEERDSCPQHAMMTGNFAGDENCLFLNIFTPSLSPDTKEALAVMVWIHGGCYKSGSGSSVMYGPDHLLTQDVILVTINYRLGMLGFLSLPAAGVTGNNGLKDQVMALRWVQRNIAKFGGDPNRVTLFGESAGGSSVHFHLLSPMSKGLFHRAIAQSGTALHNWAYADTDFMINKAFTIGERMKCNATGSQELLLCLKTAPAELIVDNTIGKVFSTSNTVVPMRPTSEDENASDEEVFLTSHPAQLLKQGKLVNDVPFIAGVNSREGIIYMLDVQAISGFWQDPNYHMSNVIADLLDMSAKEADELSKMAISYYTGQMFVYKEQAIELVDMFSDVAFVLGTDRTVKKHAQLSRSPVYMYIFSYEGELGISKLAFNTIMEGVSHADELGYIFHTAISPQVDDTPDSTTLTRMVKMWTNFAKTGEPIPEVDSLLDAKWNPSSSNGHFFMNISNNLQTQIGPFEDRMRFWEDMLGPYPETSLS